MAEHLITFAAGASYGATTVLIGQPLDTLKVRLQSIPAGTEHGSTIDLFRREGIRGLYRGGLPLFVGGSVMRSAQFGVSAKVKHWLDEHPGIKQYQFKVLGLVDWQLIVAGIAGGIGRGLIEIPTDVLKTRRQVERNWGGWSHLFDGSMITLARNTVLYSAFMIYIDLSRQLCRAGYVPSILMTEEQNTLTPFAKGALCANAAWLTVWPADVIKSQRQSGNYENRSTVSLLIENFQKGRLFKGLVPGLVRSSLANGSSMVVYEWVQKTLTNYLDVERKDMA